MQKKSFFRLVFIWGMESVSGHEEPEGEGKGGGDAGKGLVKLAQKRSRYTDVPQLMKEKTYVVRSRSPEGGDVVAPSAFTRTPRGGQKISLYQTIYVLGSVWGC